MARKKKSLGSKLGGWADQAALTSNVNKSAKPVPSPTQKSKATRENYLVSYSLIDRLTDAAQQHGMQQNEVMGHLLTWALDQLEAGKVTLPTR